METRKAGVVVNIMACPVHQANYLLDQQIRQREQAFVEERDVRERVMRVRLEVLRNQ